MGAKATVLWICGKATSEDLLSGGITWEIAGVFASEERAKAACRTPWYFIGPQNLNEILPHERGEWKGAYYPLADEVNDWTEEEMIQGYRNN